jgi:sarcosine oxidase subunit beta
MNSRAEIEILKWSSLAWAELNAALAQTMEYQQCGQLRFVERPEDLEVACDWINFERNAGLSPELLEPAEVRKIEPLLEGPIIAATWAENASTVTPFLAVRAILKDAVRSGLELQSHNSVLNFVQRNGRVVGVVTNKGEVEADSVILACGPWTSELAAKVGLDLPILPRRAQCLATVGLPQTIRTVIAACESAGGVVAGYTQIQQAPSGQVLFNTVLGGGVSTAGVQDHITEVDPVFVCNSIRQLLWLFPSLSKVELLRSWVRYEAVTPDDRFIVGLSSIQNLYIAAGDGGSGFGRAPAIARVIADSLENRIPPFDPSLWSPERFEGKLAA